jgi:phosphoserine phosphatase
MYVDLDHSLVNANTLSVGLARLGLHKPWLLPAAALHLLVGKAELKDFVAGEVDLDPSALPYRRHVLGFLREQHMAGRRLVLATAANARVARRVADYLGIFADVLASSRITLLKGRRKLAAVLAHAAGPFDYLGDSDADLPLFRAARGALLVCPSEPLLRTLAREGKVLRVFK